MNTLPDPDAKTSRCGGDGDGEACGIQPSPSRCAGFPLMNTFPDPAAVIVGGNEPCPEVGSPILAALDISRKLSSYYIKVIIDCLIC